MIWHIRMAPIVPPMAIKGSTIVTGWDGEPEVGRSRCEVRCRRRGCNDCEMGLDELRYLMQWVVVRGSDLHGSRRLPAPRGLDGG